jgi:hypothetical protein
MEKAMSGLSRADRATLTDLLRRLGTTAEVQADALARSGRTRGDHGFR